MQRHCCYINLYFCDNICAFVGCKQIKKIGNSCIRRLRQTANSEYWLRHVCQSVRPRGKTRLPLDGFSWNLIFEKFS